MHPNQDTSGKVYIITRALKGNSYQDFFPNTFSFSICYRGETQVRSPPPLSLFFGSCGAHARQIQVKDKQC